MPSNKIYDIGLVSTSSKNRFAAYKELLNNKINNIILEKFLFQIIMNTVKHPR